MRVKTVLMLSAGLMAMAGATQAWAGDEPATVDEVIVTAEKREASLQDVPVAVSAYTADTRQLLGITTMQDVASFTPGLSYSSSDDRVFLRGVGRQTNTNGSDPGVATYSDGVYDAQTNSVGASEFFVERLEVLRGPQGTLYGRNSIGGAINAISKRPTQEFSGDFRATLGSYGRLNLEALVSGGLTDSLRLSFGAARYNQDDGYYDNASGGPSEGGAGESTYFELQADADFGENMTAWLKVSTNTLDGRNRSTIYTGPYDYALYPNAYIAPGSAYGYGTVGVVSGGPSVNPSLNRPGDFNADTPSRQRLSDSFNLSTDVTWSLPGVDVRYIGGYRTYKYLAVSDLDYTSVESYTVPLDPGFSICAFFIPGCGPVTIAPSQAFIYSEDKSYGSSELNFSSTGEGALQWIAGLYYYAEELDQASRFNTPNLVQIRTPANGPANPDGDFVYAASSLESRSSAIFGQIDWQFADQLKLTAGLRYTRDEKSGFEYLRVVCYGCGGYEPNQYGTSTPALDVTAASVSAAAAPGVSSPMTIDATTGIARRGLSGTWSALTGTLGLEWSPDEDTLAFAKYSRGYKSGGFNAGGITPLPETGEESVEAFELGYKRTFGRTLLLNVAAYSYNYKGLQVPLTVTTSAGINLTQFFNLDESSSSGVEVESVWRPITPLRLSLSYAYAQSEIKEACCFVDGVDPLGVQPGAQPVGPLVGGQQPQSLKGQDLPQTPTHKLALNASYDFEFSAGTLTLSGTYAWKDDSYAGVFNRDYTMTPGFDQVDLRAVWRDADDRFRIIGYVRNAFDEQGYDTASGSRLASPPAAANSYGVIYGLTPPRTYGLQLQYSFN